jgi:hypothetical protein
MKLKHDVALCFDWFVIDQCGLVVALTRTELAGLSGICVAWGSTREISSPTTTFLFLWKGHPAWVTGNRTERWMRTVIEGDSRTRSPGRLRKEAWCPPGRWISKIWFRGGSIWITGATDLGEKAERVGATGVLGGRVAGTIEEVLAVCSVAWVGLRSVCFGVGRSGESGISGSGATSFGTSLRSGDWGEALVPTEAASVAAGSVPVEDRLRWGLAGFSSLAASLGTSTVFSESW